MPSFNAPCQVLHMLFEDKLHTKVAALALYALQTASSNLKRMELEKPRPTRVVIDPDKVAETPLGMTPWAENSQGHEPEDVAPPQPESARAKKRRPKSAPQPQTEPALTPVDAAMLRAKFIETMKEEGFCTADEIQDYCFQRGPDPLDKVFPKPTFDDESDDDLPPPHHPGPRRAVATKCASRIDMQHPLFDAPFSKT